MKSNRRNNLPKLLEIVLVSVKKLFKWKAFVFMNFMQYHFSAHIGCALVLIRHDAKGYVCVESHVLFLYLNVNKIGLQTQELLNSVIPLQNPTLGVVAEGVTT
jgi:hypothetical protein